MPEPALLTRLEQDPQLHTDAMRVRDAAAAKLARIVEVFPHYTCHDITHAMAAASICEWLAGQSLLDQLNAPELFVLFSAMCLHDVGMALEAHERDAIEADPGFASFVSSCGLQPDDALAEWVRRAHHTRSAEVIRRSHGCPGGIPIADPGLAYAVALLCESHGLEDLDDFERYNPFYAFGSSGVTLCLPLLGVLLRLSDLLHVTSDRTPLAVLPYVSLESSTSRGEWAKHIAAVGIAPGAGTVAQVNCICDDPDTHRSILRLCDYANREFAYGARMLGLLSAHGRQQYKLAVERVVPSVQADGYKPWMDLQFQLDREGILNLLTGSRIYQGPGAVLRELLMNAVDATRQSAQAGGTARPIRVDLNTSAGTVAVADGGTGMGEADVRGFLLKLGQSFYWSEEYKRRYRQLERIEPLSEFGIGFASCFLAADHVVLETKRDGSEGLLLDMYDLVGFVAARRSAWTEAGTTVTLHLKGAVVKDMEGAVRCLADTCPHVEVDILASVDGTTSIVACQPFAPEAKELVAPYFRDRETGFFVEHQHFSRSTDGIEGTMSMVMHRQGDVVMPRGIAWYRQGPGAELPRRLSQLGFSVPPFGNDVQSFLGGMNVTSFGFDLDLAGEMRLQLDASRTRVLPSERNRDIVRKLDRHLVAFLVGIHERYWQSLPRDARLDAHDALSMICFQRAMGVGAPAPFAHYEPVRPLVDLFLAHMPIDVWVHGQPPSRMTWDEIRSLGRPISFYRKFGVLSNHQDRVAELIQALPEVAFGVEDPFSERASTLMRICDHVAIHVSDGHQQAYPVLRPWAGCAADLAARRHDPSLRDAWDFVLPFVPDSPYAVVPSVATRLPVMLGSWLNANHPKICRLVAARQAAQASGMPTPASTQFLLALHNSTTHPGADPDYISYVQGQQRPMLDELGSGGWIGPAEKESLKLAAEDFVSWEWMPA